MPSTATPADALEAILILLSESDGNPTPETQQAIQRLSEAADDPAKLQALLGDEGEPEVDPEGDEYLDQGPVSQPQGTRIYARDGLPMEYAKHKFGSTQFNVPAGPLSNRLKRLADAIPDADLASDGREEERHVTVKYGLHTGDSNEVRRIVGMFGPVRVRLGRTSIFPAKEADVQRGGDQYDVVKVDVFGADIHRLNKLISDSLEHTDTHPAYAPHITLAYVKPGKGKKYVGDESVMGQEVVFGDLIFSDQEGEQTIIHLMDQDASTLPSPDKLDDPEIREAVAHLYRHLGIPEGEISAHIEEAKSILAEEVASTADHPWKAKMLALASRAEREGDRGSAAMYRKSAAELKTCKGDCGCEAKAVQT